MLVQIADKGDKIDDPSIAWPDSRRTVEMGTLEITRVLANSDVAQKKIVFMPNALIPGIEVEDPMIDQRSAIYAVSFARRSR
jgi:catalase